MNQLLMDVTISFVYNASLIMLIIKKKVLSKVLAVKNNFQKFSSKKEIKLRPDMSRESSNVFSVKNVKLLRAIFILRVK